jgi:hypothetical protein
MTLLSSSNSLEVAEVLADKLPQTLSRSARTLFKALTAVAVEKAQAKGYSPATTHVSFHLPLEVLASICGIHRATAWRNLKVLKELGVVDARPHKGTLRGETRNTGMVFQIRLNPATGSKARLSYDDLKHKWRDLQRDVLAKKTAYRQLKGRMQQSIENSIQLDIKALMRWVIPETYISPVTSDSCMSGKDALFRLLDVKNSPRQERNKAVELAAEALAMTLADSKSVSFYQLLL